MDRQLYCYDYVDASLASIEAALRQDLRSILEAATEAAASRGDEVLGRVHAPLGGFEIGREVRIEAGEPTRRGDQRLDIPLAWESTRSSGLFPRMDAHLEVAVVSEDPALCQVMFFGVYDPPGGVVGAAGDSLVMHRIAEATAHRFLEDTVRGLRRALGQDGPSDRDDVG